jgi:uncharacterized lipoprotein
MRRRSTLPLLLVLVIALLAGCGWIQPVAQPSRPDLSLDGQVQMLRDPAGTLEVRAVAARGDLQPTAP